MIQSKNRADGYISLILAFCFVFFMEAKADNRDMETQWHLYHMVGMSHLSHKNYSKATEELIKAKQLLEENSAQETGLYVQTLTDLGLLYHNNDEISEFAEIRATLERLTAVDFDKISLRGIRILRIIADFYSRVQLFSEAEKILNNLIKVTPKYNQPRELARVLHSMAYAKYRLGDTDSAINFEKQSIEQANLPESWRSLCWYYNLVGQTDSLNSIIPKAFVSAREPVLQYFVNSTAIERARYWVNAGCFFNRFIPFYAYSNPSKDLNSAAYDAILLSKGMLLNADVTTEELINSSGDEGIIQKFYRYKQLSEFSKLTLDDAAEKDYLGTLIQKKQKQLTNKFRNRFRYSWVDVKKSLREGAIAVEFFSVGETPEGEWLAALVIDKNSDYPQLVRLCSIDDLSKVDKRNLYTSSELYDLIWAPILETRSSVTDIYFSPSGVLHNVAIEYCNDADGMDLMSSYGVSRVSSTRSLIRTQENNDYKHFILFGGVNYNGYNQDPSENVRGGVAYLPATKIEVDSISQILSNPELTITSHVGNDASEAQVKDSAISNGDLIHFATHGFYISMSKQEAFPSLDYLVYNSLFANTESHDNYREDYSLNQSGLLLAGANTTLTGNVSTNQEDGILYASEVSSANLTNTKAVFLSACETALGDLSFSEGVFGLQRGFKLAGVKTLLMSLWKVNDEATMKLMCFLYYNLKNGLDLSEALSTARMDLRMTDDGKWDSPEYYDAFILLDAPLSKQ